MKIQSTDIITFKSSVQIPFNNKSIYKNYFKGCAKKYHHKYELPIYSRQKYIYLT